MNTKYGSLRIATALLFALVVGSCLAGVEPRSGSAESLGAVAAGANESFDKLRMIERQVIPVEVQTNPPKLAAWGVEHTRLLRAQALDFYSRFPQDPRRWEAVVDYAFGMAFTVDRPYLEQIRQMLKQATMAKDIEDKLWAQTMAIQIDDMIYLANVLHDYRVGVGHNDIASRLDELAGRVPDSRFRPQVEMEYVDLLKTVDAKASEARLTVLANDKSPDVAGLAAGKLRVMQMATQPVEMSCTAVDGREVDLTKLRGKVVLVDCWATWCVPCVQELPNVKAVYDKYHDKGFEVVGISLDRETAKLHVIDFAREHAIPWPECFDGKVWKTEFAVRFGVNELPATFLLDKDGKLAETDARGEKLEPEVKRLLGL